MPSFEDIYFQSSTGVNRIHARKCIPDGKPIAIVQINHGIAEYIERYDDFMNFLANNGFVVVGEDHLGHGKSIERPEDKGFFAEKDGWNYVLKDIDQLRNIIREDYPDLPYIFFGHSMGSFLTRHYIINNPDKYDAAIICGTEQMLTPKALFGYGLAQSIVKAKGPRANGKLLNDVGFAGFNKRIPYPMTESDWVCASYETVKKYVADPLCGFIPNAGVFRDMMGSVLYIINQKNIDAMSKTQPIFFIAGKDDPVGEYGKGVERAYKAFCKAGIQDVTIKLYPGMRHEILNEDNHELVYNDVLAWLNAKLEKIAK